MVTQNTSIIITMTTRDRAVNQHCPKGTWDKPIHPHLHRQIQMNTSACAHAKLCTYTPAHMHTHTSYVVQGIYRHLLGDDTQLSAHALSAGHGQIHHKLSHSRLVHKGPLPPEGPSADGLKKHSLNLQGYLLGLNDHLNISYIILNRRILSFFKLVLAQNVK